MVWGTMEDPFVRTGDIGRSKRVMNTLVTSGESVNVHGLLVACANGSRSIQLSASSTRLEIVIARCRSPETAINGKLLSHSRPVVKKSTRHECLSDAEAISVLHDSGTKGGII